MNGTTTETASTFYRDMFRLALPIVMQNLITTAVSSADVIMLGFVSQSALAAGSLASQIMFILNLVYTGISSGIIMLAAQYWGKKDTHTIEKIMGIGMRLSILISLVFFVLALFCPSVLMHIFTNDPSLFKPGKTYLRVVSFSYLFMGISQIYLCTMRTIERVVFATVVNGTALILNIVLNAVFIFGLFGAPKMGIAGVALATTIARFIELGLCIVDTLRFKTLRFRPITIFQHNKLLFTDFMKYSLPAFGNEVAWGVAFSMYSVIMGHLGSDAVAANSLANIVKNIIACICLGIGSGSGILVGNELGRGALQRARDYGSRLSKIAVLSGAISGVVILLCSPLVLKFAVSLSPQAHEYLRIMLYMCSYYMIGKSVNATEVAGIFCAGGDTRFGLLCDTVVMWLIVVPLGAVAAFVLKLPVLAVYFILNLDEMLKLPAVYRHYKKYQWVKDLTK